MEPPPPLLPGPGRLRPRAASSAHVLAAGYDGPLSLEVFNDVFRAGRPAADGGRRDALAAAARGRAAGRPPRCDGYAFVELGGDVGARRSSGADRLGFRARRPAPLEAGAAVAARRDARSSSTTSAVRRAASPRSRSRRADPDALRRARRGAARAEPAARPRARRGRPHHDRRARRHARCSSAAPTLGARLLTAVDEPARRRARCGSTTSRSRSRSTSSTRPRCSTARCSGCELAGRRRARRARRARAQPRRASADGGVRLRAQRAAGRRRRAPSSSTSPSPATTCFAAARGDARARRAAARDPRQLLRRPRGADAARRRRDRADARARRALRPRRARRAPALLHARWSAPSLFFEVLERRGGYDGYGASNSPVRMAAQIR